MADKLYTVGLPKGLLCAVERIAAQTGVPVATVVSVAIREFTKQEHVSVLVHQFWESGGWRLAEEAPPKVGFLGRIISTLAGSG